MVQMEYELTPPYISGHGADGIRAHKALYIRPWCRWNKSSQSPIYPAMVQMEYELTPFFVSRYGSDGIRAHTVLYMALMKSELTPSYISGHSADGIRAPTVLLIRSLSSQNKSSHRFIYPVMVQMH
ncbi:hypothetical protein RRG08_043074 [Elysia crispata]|uniref:Uncharacterized protein n=1 Tax=Elysia crispata TaxID=231223 RepID=A0AAE0XY11_9GAST|nr:hypothetical protein RRG08_043074 [Elysia crispata]